MVDARTFVLFPLLLLLLVHRTNPIITPYHSVPECSADAPLIVPNFKANWFKAIEYCHYLGRTLVTVATEPAQVAIDELLATAGVYPSDQPVWCAANDLADVDNFHWQLTGRPVAIGWTNWRDGRHRREPAAEGDPFKVRCVTMQRSADVIVVDDQQELLPATSRTWSWMVVNCWQEHYFICERTGLSRCR